MGKKDIGLKVYFQNAVRYADLWNGAVFRGKQIVKAEELQEVTPVQFKSDKRAMLERTGDMVMKQSYDGQKFVMLALENQEKIDYGMPVRVMLQEALEYDRQIREFKHFEYFRTELCPLFEMFQRRNSKEEFMQYVSASENCQRMDDESWYMLGQLTNSKDIKALVYRNHERERSSEGMCKAIEDLKAEGKAEFVIALLEEYGALPVELKKKILEQMDLQILDEWFRIAIHAKSVEEFVHQSHLT